VSVALAPADGHLASVSVAICGFMRLRGAFAGPEVRLALGPESGLAIGFTHDRAVDAAAVYALLNGPFKDQATGITASLHELWASLPLWLAIHEPLLCGLSADGALAERGIVPYFFGSVGPTPSRVTSGVLGEKSLCVLMRPHGVPPATDDPDLEAFELYVRSFGADDMLAQHFIEQLAAWDAAGRPATRRLWLKVYPLNSEPPPQANEAVISKRWTTLVVAWE
jgi:protein-L-isoaspartate(D-aspartate) O-methyltransferase